MAEFTVRPEVVPRTVMVSSISSTTSFVGVSVKFAVPLASPAAIVMSNAVTVSKSTAVAVPLPATFARTVVAEPSVVEPSNVAVTVIVVAPSPSPTLLSSTVSVIEVGVPSSSVRLIVSEFTVRPVDVPLTVMVSSSSSSVSSVGVSVKVPVPLAAPAAIEMLKDDTAAKSTTFPDVPLCDTLTLTVLAAANRVVPSTVAVTVIVVSPSPSPTSLSSTVSVIVSGAPSSSVIVPSTLSAVATTPLARRDRRVRRVAPRHHHPSRPTRPPCRPSPTR